MKRINLDKLHFHLVVTVEYDEVKNCLWMHQKQYNQSLLEKYGQPQAKISITPADIKLVKDDGAKWLIQCAKNGDAAGKS